MAKCVECGFLGARAKDDGRWVEADDGFRAEGKPAQELWAAYPLCFKRVIQVHQEADRESGTSRDEKVRAVIRAERECDSFTAWRPGYTPREHDELLDRLAAQAREDRRDVEARAFQEHLLTVQEDFERRLADRAEQQRWTLVLVAGGFTVVGALVALMLRV